MAINKNKLLIELKADLKAAETQKTDWTKKIQGWKDAYDGKPYGNEETGKSQIVSRDIKKQSEWQHASIIDPFVNNDNVIKCTPVTWEDTDSAKQNELLLNTQFVRKFNRFNFMTKAAKVLDMEGTVVIQCGWDYQDEEIEVEKEVVLVDDAGFEYIDIQVVTETIVKRNQPTAKVCRNEDIYFDPTCQDNLDEAQFVIYRYETDLSTLRLDGRYKNLDRLSKNANSSFSDDDYDPEDVTDFEFRDAPRKKLVVYEYWGNYDLNGDGIAEPIVCAWVNDILIRLENNPYPDGKSPFIVVPFYSVPFQLHGEANAELIGDNQKVKTAITRGIIDNMAQSTNGQVGIRKGAIDPINRKRWLAGKNFEFNGSQTDFWQGNYNQIPGSAFDMLGLQNNEIESMTGTKSFSGGINAGSLGQHATGARGALDATSTRRMNIVRNVAENLIKPLMRKWMSYNSEFLDESEVVRITNEEFVPIRRDDLSGRIDIDISVSTAEDNAAKAQELAFLIQTMGPNEDPAIRQMLRAEHLKLMRLPEAAKMVEEYSPAPDPVQEQLRQLELENMMLSNEKLRADIADKYARASENQIDAQLKTSKAAVEAAKARKLSSEADKLDLDFITKDEGIDQMDRLAIEEFKRKSNLDSLAFQAINNDKQLGVTR